MILLQCRSSLQLDYNRKQVNMRDHPVPLTTLHEAESESDAISPQQDSMSFDKGSEDQFTAISGSTVLQLKQHSKASHSSKSPSSTTQNPTQTTSCRLFLQSWLSYFHLPNASRHSTVPE